MKILFYKLLKRYFKKQFQKTESIILQENYFSIICMLDSNIKRIKEGE